MATAGLPSLAPEASRPASSCDDWKARGDAWFRRGDLSAAIGAYDRALSGGGLDAVAAAAALANRSLARLRSGDSAGALADARKAATVRPRWPKARAREAAALAALGRDGAAWDAYACGEALCSAPEDAALLAALQRERRALERASTRRRTLGVRRGGFSGAQGPDAPTVVAAAVRGLDAWTGGDVNIDPIERESSLVALGFSDGSLELLQVRPSGGVSSLALFRARAFVGDRAEPSAVTKLAFVSPLRLAVACADPQTPLFVVEFSLDPNEDALAGPLRSRPSIRIASMLPLSLSDDAGRVTCLVATEPESDGNAAGGGRARPFGALVGTSSGALARWDVPVRQRPSFREGLDVGDGLHENADNDVGEKAHRLPLLSPTWFLPNAHASRVTDLALSPLCSLEAVGGTVDADASGAIECARSMPASSVDATASTASTAACASPWSSVRLLASCSTDGTCQVRVSCDGSRLATLDWKSGSVTAARWAGRLGCARPLSTPPTLFTLHHSDEGGPGGTCRAAVWNLCAGGIVERSEDDPGSSGKSPGRHRSEGIRREPKEFTNPSSSHSSSSSPSSPSSSPSSVPFCGSTSEAPVCVSSRIRPRLYSGPAAKIDTLPGRAFCVVRSDERFADESEREDKGDDAPTPTFAVLCADGTLATLSAPCVVSDSRAAYRLQPNRRRPTFSPPPPPPRTPTLESLARVRASSRSLSLSGGEASGAALAVRPDGEVAAASLPEGATGVLRAQDGGTSTPPLGGGEGAACLLAWIGQNVVLRVGRMGGVEVFDASDGW